MEQSYYLELCSEPIRFDSVSQITDVFFDDSNKQVHRYDIFMVKSIKIYKNHSIAYFIIENCSCLLWDLVVLLESL